MSNSRKLHLCDHLSFQELASERNQLAAEVARLQRTIDASTIFQQVAQKHATRELAELRAANAALFLELGRGPEPFDERATLPFSANETAIQ